MQMDGETAIVAPTLAELDLYCDRARLSCREPQPASAAPFRGACGLRPRSHRHRAKTF
jgi:hypothetical protein